MTPKTPLEDNALSLFSKSLKTKVDGYFALNHQNQNLHPVSYIMQCVILACLAYVISAVCMISLPYWAKSIIIGVDMSLIFSFIGFNIMHSAAHNTYTPNKQLNTSITHASNIILGVSMYLWKKKHNVAHHYNTNIMGKDPDPEIPFIRVSHTQLWHPYNRYQHLYAPFLYSILYLFWMFYTDIAKYLKGEVWEMKWHDHIAFWMGKGLHILILIMLVMTYGKVVWIGYALFLLSTGLINSLVFQPAHLVKETLVHDHDHQAQSKNEWMLDQIATTSDFAPNNWFLGNIVGGLNMQVEHHLFPGIHPGYYMKIHAILKLHCEEFGVKYHSQPTFKNALKSHFGFLKNMGRRPVLRIL